MKKKRVSTGRFRGGSLVLISISLFGSAFLRLGVEAAPAIPKEAHQEIELDESLIESISAPPTNAADLYPILQQFRMREKKIKRREEQILDRLEALSTAERAIDKRLTELASAESKLRKTLALASGAVEADLAKLTGVYEKMKPKDAAKLFEEMDQKFAAGFLARMKPESVAKILAGLRPESAYGISLIFAGRNANVPKR